MSKRTKKIISNIIFYTVLAVLYSVAIFAIVTKFNGGSIFLFNTRVDVVLTDSMSSKNYHHLDFLEGTSQIQAFDMVVSEKIDENTELKVKDVVLFKNPKLNNQTVVHRIINITQEGISFEIDKCEKVTFNNQPMTKLIDDGMIKMESLNVTDVVIEAYSPKEYSNYFVFFLGKNVYDTVVETTKLSENVYKHIVTFSRNSSVPFSTTITSATDQELYVSSIKYVSKTKGDIIYDSKDLVVDETGGYSYLFQSYYLYEIRADKSSTADGIFEREVLISKVNGVIPKVGHVVHFLQSLPGLITIVGLSIIITFASYFMSKPQKEKKQPEAVDSAPPVEVPEEAKEEKPTEEITDDKIDKTD